MGRRPTKVRVIAACIAASFAVIALMCAGFGHWTSPSRVKSAREYEAQISRWPQAVVKDLPAKIPSGATGAQMLSDSPSAVPSPGHFIALRFFGSPADVQSAIAAGKQGLLRVPKGHERDMNLSAESWRLRFCRDAETPRPVRFQCFPLVDDGENFAGVAVDSLTGEILYWATIN